MVVNASDVAAVAKRVGVKGKKKAEVSDTPIPDTPAPPVQVPVKKEPTAAQLAAREKAAETRRLKKEQKEQEKEVEKQLEIQKALLAEKEAAKEKRKAAKMAKDIDKSVDEEVEPKVKKIKVEDSEKPPAWFQKHVTMQMQKETPEVKFEKEQKEEAKAVAVQKWGEPKIRKGVQKEMSSHEARLYRMMFG